MQDARFVAYIAVLSAVVALMLAFQTRYGHAHVGYYVLLCSLLGSVTVMACKGVSTFLTLWICCGCALPTLPQLRRTCRLLARDAASFPHVVLTARRRSAMPFDQPILYLLVLVLAATAVLQIRYLNTAMERFGNTETVPVYYVLFTVCTIVGSNVLYKVDHHHNKMAAAAAVTMTTTWLPPPPPPPSPPPPPT